MAKINSPSAAFWQLFISMVLIVVFCLHVWKVFPLSLLTAVENLSYDWRLTFAKQEEMDKRVVIVAIDEKSLQEIGRWPWSRNHLATLINHLFDHYRVTVLAMDMAFPEPDHSSGLQVLESLAEGELKNDPTFRRRFEQVRASLAYDYLLAQSLLGKPVVLGFHLNNQKKEASDARQILPKPILDLWETGHTYTTLPGAEGYVGNLEILQKSASSGGFFSNSLIDGDGVTRRLSLIHRYQNSIYPSLALATVRTLLSNPATTIGFANMGSNKAIPWIPQWVDVGTYRIAMDEEGGVLVPYPNSQTRFRTISAVDIINKSLPANALTGTIALLGATAIGLGDQMQTPFSRKVAGVEVHANLVSGILDGRIKERSDRLMWLDSAMLVALCSLMILVGNASYYWNGFFALASSSLLVAINLLAWDKINLVLSLGVPLLAIFTLLLVNFLFLQKVNKSSSATDLVAESEKKSLGNHQEADSFWEDPPEAWRLDTSKLMVKDQSKKLD